MIDDDMPPRPSQPILDAEALAKQGDFSGLREIVDGLAKASPDVRLRAAYVAQKAAPDPLGFMVSREIYKHLERVADAFEDVANEIDSLVVDHA